MKRLLVLIILFVGLNLQAETKFYREVEHDSTTNSALAHDVCLCLNEDSTTYLMFCRFQYNLYVRQNCRGSYYEPMYGFSMYSGWCLLSVGSYQRYDKRLILREIDTNASHVIEFIDDNHLIYRKSYVFLQDRILRADDVNNSPLSSIDLPFSITDLSFLDGWGTGMLFSKVNENISPPRRSKEDYRQSNIDFEATYIAYSHKFTGSKENDDNTLHVAGLIIEFSHAKYSIYLTKDRFLLSEGIFYKEGNDLYLLDNRTNAEITAEISGNIFHFTEWPFFMSFFTVEMSPFYLEGSEIPKPIKFTPEMILGTYPESDTIPDKK